MESGKDNDMKRMMNKNNENKRTEKTVEALLQLFGNLFGENVPVVAVVGCGGGVAEENEDFLKALEDYFSESEERQSDIDKVEKHKEPEESCEEISEGDGEEVFDEMLSDLISFAGMVERLDTVLTAVATGKMCPIRGMSETDSMVDIVSEVLRKWAKYKEPKA
ncbi:hypothetical protein [Porcincola intestinalis]|uniref:Uncharacterized protein n=1 Tax=Porcincola intestinalis TaxID=2606632 RepID=A0A6L5X0M6_9FIRM|nr:hypothetical protein [Porcincola intestinalis]MSS13820.1 hypothetical protein [Porcincola intestinalis]